MEGEEGEEGGGERKREREREGGHGREEFSLSPSLLASRSSQASTSDVVLCENLRSVI